MVNLTKIDSKNYTIDFDKLKIIIGHVNEIVNISKHKNLKLILIGHLSLIFLSRKIYRDISDIDILIKKEDFLIWIENLEAEWEWFGDTISLDYGRYLKMFLKNQLQKFASNDIFNCAVSENLGALYEIKNDFNIYKKFNIFNKIKTNEDNLIKDLCPQWIYHDPKKKLNRNLPLIEKNKNFFKIRFCTNSVGKHFKSFIIFYDKNLKHKKIVECKYEIDINHNEEIHSYWLSPDLDLNEYNNCFYRLFIHKYQYSIRLINKNTKIILDCYLSNNDLLNMFNIDIQYIQPIQEISSIPIILNDHEIYLSNPHYALSNKFDREKDRDDFEFYKFLLDEYPLLTFG